MVHSKTAFIAGAAVAGLLVLGLSACSKTSKSSVEQNENASAASPTTSREDSFPPPDTMPIPSPPDTTRHPR